MDNEQEVKSHVQEFLKECSDKFGYNQKIGEMLIRQMENEEWLRFCNELHLLLDRSKLLDEVMNDIKERHKTENKQ